MESATERLLKGVETSSAEDTVWIATQFAAELPCDAFLALIGDLGAGKTTFVRALARGLGITSRVKSPSFNVCLLYNIPNGGIFAHVDAYRLDTPEQFDALLLDEIAPTPRILCVEWADRIDIPSGAYVLNFSSEQMGDSRRIKMEIRK